MKNGDNNLEFLIFKLTNIVFVFVILSEIHYKLQHQNLVCRKLIWQHKTDQFNRIYIKFESYDIAHIVVRYASDVKSTGTIAATLFEIRHVWLITLVAIVYVDLYFFFWTYIWIFARVCNSLSLISRLLCLSSAFFLGLAVRPLLHVSVKLTEDYP